MVGIKRNNDTSSVHVGVTTDIGDREGRKEGRKESRMEGGSVG